MTRAPSLKFAIVREDPTPELELLERAPRAAALCVASGGCTLFELKRARPDARVVGFDFNPEQLAHVRRKAAAVARGDLAALNLGTSSPAGLNQRGEFEGLFRVLRQAIVDLVTTPDEVERFFAAGTTEAEREALRGAWFASPYWRVAFEVALYHPLLDVMFTEAATQHAEPGSYPRYFQGVFERGLRAPDAATNPFLHHVLLGRYVAGSEPGYMRAGEALEVELVQGSLPDVEGLSGFGVVSLSNVFDWSDDALTKAWADALIEGCAPGTWIVIRQLNNTRDLRPFFEPAFRFDDALGADLLGRDRSLFYNRIEVAVRGEDG
jgi:S-adenosylmethionine-diacylglycerol 3-amino-3-carboxypropyl transferase